MLAILMTAIIYIAVIFTYFSSIYMELFHHILKMRHVNFLEKSPVNIR